MRRYLCTTHGPLDEATKAAVSEGLARIEASRFSTPIDDVHVSFAEVEAGMWYTAAKISKASFVSGTVPKGTTQDVRAEHMADLCQMFSELTGSSYHDVVVVAADEPT